MPWETPKINLIKIKIGGAQLQDQTKFPLNFHEIPSSGLGGVTDTSCVPPFLCWLPSPCFALETPKINFIKI